jgi:general nucleoside transport system ATP-binding protein
MQGINKHFGNSEAFSHAFLKLRRGSIPALLGENGAGKTTLKTTLMRIAFGMINPDAGKIRVDDIPKSIHSLADVIAAGIGMVHQHFMLAPAITVAENIELGNCGKYDARDSADQVRKLGNQTGLVLDPSTRVNAFGEP